ncbi:SAF domain-containing protein [Actinokineospora xionganensis]|uniref:SAF domain-containing protein n=1 Tax=Actinokineospora xionganensis TaxID=2684470 RepID=A0ABR7LFF2_9PSEU|nr:SAF domain-containing protein [Actinokineospora xionganensis]MBC6451367.1 SAF domain-containing protein [Actinokineospora xionganensis]
MLAALIVALAAWANVVLVNRLDDRVEVLSVVRTVPAFERITDADLGVARIAADPGLRPVPASERASVVGKVAAVELRPGTLVVREQVTEARPPFPGQQLVGLAVKPGQMPGGGVVPGDMVLVVTVASEQPGSSAVPGGDGVRAQVVRVGPPSSDGSVTVDVVVSVPNGPPLASASSAGQVALVLLPRGG